MTETTIYQNEKKRKLKKSSLWNIFERDNNGGYEKRALLYLDILSYCVAANGTPVTFWNLAKWLIYERNREFLHYYSGNKSHTKQADRIKEKRDKIENADPYERYSSAIAIAKTGDEEALSLLKRMSDTASYHNLVARGSIEGLKIIAINSDEETQKEDIENFMVEKIKRTEESRLRRSAVSSLGYVGRYKENKERIVKELKALLRDESVYVRNTACVALANVLENTGDSDAIKELKHIAEQDNGTKKGTNY